jgi:hypothetical protein
MKEPLRIFKKAYMFHSNSTAVSVNYTYHIGNDEVNETYHQADITDNAYNIYNYDNNT